MDGFFKVHRKILDSQVFAHQTALKIWIWCLAKVTFKERFVSLKVGKGETTIKLNPGQFIFGRFKAEEELNIDGSTIYKWMQKFSTKEFDMITIKSNNQYSIITLNNWERYNIINGNEEQPCNNCVTTAEQLHNNCVTQTRKIKKDNNEKNEKNLEARETIFISEVWQFKDQYPDNMIRKFIDYWIEKNKSKTKMRFELQETFEINRRLATWANRDNNFKNGSNSQNNTRSIKRVNDLWNKPD